MNLSRKFFGVIYLIGAVANIAMIIFQPEIYREFANQALIPFYQNAWNSIVIPNLYVFVGLTIVFEVGLGLLFLGGRRFLGLAYLISLAFNIVLIPFGLLFLYSNGVLVLVQFYLITRVSKSQGFGFVREEGFPSRARARK